MALTKKRRNAIRLPKRLDLLTKRQLRIMRMVGEGYSLGEIGDVLDISVKTVDAHKDHSCKKLRIRRQSYRKWAFKVAAYHLFKK